MPYVNTEAMTLHLAEIAKAVAPGAHAVLVLDGAGWHSSGSLVVPGNITLLALPPYAPEINPPLGDCQQSPACRRVENIWQYLRANKLAVTVFDSYAEIVDKCCDAWNFFANDTSRVTSIASRSWATVSG